MVVTQGTLDAQKKLAARKLNTPPVVSATVGTNANATLEPTQAEYQKLTAAGLTPEQIKANYANVMKKSADIDAGLIPKPTIAPQKVESLASADTKIEPTASQNNQVAQSSTKQAKVVTLDPNKDDSDEHIAQVTANLKNFEATTPEIFNNKVEYDKVVGRANKSAKQQQIVDAYFNSVKATKEKVAAVDKAKVELSSMSDNILGYLNPTAEQLNVINNDPTLLARYTAATMNRNILDSIQNSFKPKDTSNVLDGLDGIAGNLSQEVLNQNQKITEMKGTYDKASIDFNNIEARVRSEAEGTGISEGAILAKINKEKALAKVNLDKLATDYNTELGTATNLAAQVKQDSEDYQQELQKTQSALSVYNSLFGNFSERNPQLDTSSSTKTTVNPITGESFQYNTETGLYDIPIGSSGTSNMNTNNIQTSYSPIEYNKSDMRTDRMSNPTAMTTDVAKQGGLVEGVDYVKGDAFPNNPNIYTAKMIGNYVDSTIKVIDTIGFKTQYGKNRWTYTDKLGLTNDARSKMTYQQKTDAIKKMYKMEGGTKLFQDIQSNTQQQSTQSYSEIQKKSMDTFVAGKQTATDEYNILTKNGLTRDDVSNYLKDSITASSDYQSALATLSPLARSVVNGGAMPTGKAKTEILNELAKSGIDNFGMGNSTFFGLKPADKIGLADLKSLNERIGVIDDLIKKTSTGTLKNASNWFLGVAEQVIPGVKSDSNFNQLKIETGKTLVQYMKDISGVAISEPERQSLLQLMPNVGMSKTQFNDALSAFKREFNNVVQGKLTVYGFDSLEMLQAALKQVPSQSQNTNPNATANFYDYAGGIISSMTGASNMINQQ